MLCIFYNNVVPMLLTYFLLQLFWTTFQEFKFNIQLDIIIFEQMKKSKVFLYSLVFLCTLVLCGEVATPIKLNTIYNISLNSNTTSVYEIILPSIKAGQNLYISGYSAINDPDQQPILKINSSSYTGTCEQQSSNLNEVCFVPYENLKEGEKFTIQASCRINCDARIIAYLSEIVELDLGEQIEISSTDSPIEQLFKIYVPTDLNYTEILLLFDVVNANPRQGVTMYLKTSRNVAYPTKSNHDNVRWLNWGLKSAAVLYKNTNIKAGDSIYVLLSIGQHSFVTFQSRKVLAQSSFLQLNQQFYDYLIPPSTYRIYTLDLSDINPTNLEFSVSIEFQQYSGSPMVEVSLNEQFTNEKKLNPSSSLTKTRFVIPAPMLKSTDSSKKLVFVKVTTNWGSTFVIYAKLRVSQVNTIERGVGEYLQVQANQNGVLVYRDAVTNYNNTQFLNIKAINEGQIEGEVKVFACLQPNSYNCNIKKTDDINTLGTNYKELNAYNDINSNRVQYNIPNHCIRESQHSEDYFCTFMIVVNPLDKIKGGKYVVQVQQPGNLIFLQQGQSYSSKVNPQQNKYFCFYLPYVGTTRDNVNSPLGLEFFVNTFDGSVKLLSSSEVIKPELANLPNAKIKEGETSISYVQRQIKQGLYYLTVFGAEYSDFVVTAVVRRFVSNSSNNQIRQNIGELNKESIRSTSIQLKDSVAQTFTLERGDQGIQFRFKVPAYGNVTLVVTDLIGKVKTFYTRDADHKRVQCVSNYCEFLAQPGESFFIEIEGSVVLMQKFSIAFKQLRECYKYPLGSPIYAYLDPKDTECVEFVVRPTQTIEVSTSLTKLELLNKDVEIAIQFEQTNYTFLMTSNSYQFEKENLVKYCGEKAQTYCTLKVKLISFGFPVNFEFVVQKLQGVITLYDGVLQRTQTKLSKSVPKYLRAPVLKSEGVEIFLTSESNTVYTIYAQLMAGVSTNNVTNYPTASSSSKDSVWTVTTSLDSPSFTVLHISKSKISAQAKALNLTVSWLAISIFSSNEGMQQAVFDIEVTQHERILRVGQQHVGFVESNQIVMYEVYPATVSLLSIRQLGNYKCFKLLDENKRQIKNEDIYIEQPRTIPLQYFVEGEYGKSCMYQISVQDFENSILQLTEGFPTRVVLEYKQTTYFLYHHTQNITFRIYQFLEGGSSSIYATPLRLNDSQTIRDVVDDLSTNKYQYRGDQLNNLEVTAKANGPDYCYNCYYLIAVKGSPAVHEDLVVVRDSTPVTIRQHMIVDSIIDPPEKQTFIYYASSYSSFNLSIDVVYGQVTVTVKSYADGPQGKIVKAQSVQDRMMLIPIKPPNSNNKMGGYSESSDSLSQQTKYKIEVEGKSHALYHLQVIKYSDTFRIVQGMVSKIQMPASGVLNLEYSILIEQGVTEINIETRLMTNPLRAGVYYKAPGENSRNQRPVIFSIHNAGKVLVLTFMGIRGHYQIQLFSVQRSPFEINVLIPKSGLTQLREDISVIATHQTVFHLYIEEDSYAIIQVFECSGHMKVRGSSQLNRVQRSTPGKNQQALVHQNVGGHFVVTTPEGVTGQYFIRVQSKQFSASINEQVSGLSYLIKYRLQKKSQKNPYQYFDVEFQSLKVLTAQYMENVTINIGKIRSTDESIKIVELQYIFGIGSSPEDVKNYMVCAPQQNAKHLTYKVVTGGDNDDTVKMNVSKLEVLNKVGQKSAYVGAHVLINIRHVNGSAYDNFVYMFEPAYLGKLKSTKVITTAGFFEIIVIISLVIGGAVIIYALGVYAITVYRGYTNTNELVEEDSQSKIAPKNAGSEFQMKAETSEIVTN